MTTSKLRARSFSASASSSASEAGAVKSTAVMAISNLSPYNNCTDNYRRKNVATPGIPITVSAVKVKGAERQEQVQAWINLQQANRVLEGLLEHRLRARTDLSLSEYEVLFRLHLEPDRTLQISDTTTQLITTPS